MEKIKVACVIVTYNRKELLLNCLSAIIQQTEKPQTVYIIDNASNDGTFEEIHERGYENTVLAGIGFRYHRMPENLGGAGGFYTGMKLAFESEECYDAIWVMDDDGEPAPNCLHNMIPYLSGHHYIAPMVISIEDRQTLAFPYKGKYDPDFLRGLGRTIPDYACPFNGIIYSRDLVERIGFPLKELFIWGDEVNYHNRAIEAGSPPITVVDAVHYHPRCKTDVFYKSIRNKEIIFVPQFWKGFCQYRNFVYNNKDKWSKKNFLTYYIIHQYFFLFKKGSWKWMKCFHKAFVCGMRGDLSPYHKQYMK